MVSIDIEGAPLHYPIYDAKTREEFLHLAYARASAG